SSASWAGSSKRLPCTAFTSPVTGSTDMQVLRTREGSSAIADDADSNRPARDDPARAGAGERAGEGDRGRRWGALWRGRTAAAFIDPALGAGEVVQSPPPGRPPGGRPPTGQGPARPRGGGRPRLADARRGVLGGGGRARAARAGPPPPPATPAPPFRGRCRP